MLYVKGLYASYSNSSSWMGGVAGSAMVLQVRRTHLRSICYHANLKGFAQSELWLLLVMCAAGSGRAVAVRVCLTATVK